MNSRIDKVNSSLTKCIANTINYKLNDPRVSGIITITSLETSTDLSSCKIKLSIMEEDKEKRQEILNVIQNSAGFIKSEIKKSVKMRVIPSLKFSIDEGMDNALRVEELLKQIKSENNN